MKKNSLIDLLDLKPVKLLFNIFNNNSQEVCIVGGCVRDALLGNLSKDIDLAINIEINEIIKILKSNNIKYNDYAYKYGSVTFFLKAQKFQITSLRQDINQSGRHANIVFTDDWNKDAARRDFTINSIYLSRNGKIRDFFNGQKDLNNNILRFLGNIEISIQEDFLRIYRYYRFLGLFEYPNVIQNYDEILCKYFENSFDYLSNNLIRQEILKMFNTSFPINCFFNNNDFKNKKYWVELVKKHFIKTNYEIGLYKCLNKVDLLIN